MLLVHHQDTAKIHRLERELEELKDRSLRLEEDLTVTRQKLASCEWTKNQQAREMFERFEREQEAFIKTIAEKELIIYQQRKSARQSDPALGELLTKIAVSWENQLATLEKTIQNASQSARLKVDIERSYTRDIILAIEGGKEVIKKEMTRIRSESSSTHSEVADLRGKLWTCQALASDLKEETIKLNYDKHVLSLQLDDMVKDKQTMQTELQEMKQLHDRQFKGLEQWYRQRELDLLYKLEEENSAKRDLNQAVSDLQAALYLQDNRHQPCPRCAAHLIGPSSTVYQQSPVCLQAEFLSSPSPRKAGGANEKTNRETHWDVEHDRRGEEVTQLVEIISSRLEEEHGRQVARLEGEIESLRSSMVQEQEMLCYEEMNLQTIEKSMWLLEATASQLEQSEARMRALQATCSSSALLAIDLKFYSSLSFSHLSLLQDKTAKIEENLLLAQSASRRLEVGLPQRGLAQKAWKRTKMKTFVQRVFSSWSRHALSARAIEEEVSWRLSCDHFASFLHCFVQWLSVLKHRKIVRSVMEEEKRGQRATLARRVISLWSSTVGCRRRKEEQDEIVARCCDSVRKKKLQSRCLQTWKVRMFLVVLRSNLSDACCTSAFMPSSRHRLRDWSDCAGGGGTVCSSPSSEHARLRACSVQGEEVRRMETCPALLRLVLTRWTR
eukprot:766303-Hanusia_phi.AAC.2